MDLIKGLQSKDRVVYEKLFRLYYAPLVRYCMGFVHQQVIAEDIVQDVYCYLWDNASKLKIEKSVKVYLYITVKNRCLNYLRHESIVDQHRKFEMAVLMESQTYEIFADDDLIKKVMKAVDELPPKTRNIFKMKVSGEMSYEEIAKSVDMSHDVVKYHIKKAYKFLRKIDFEKMGVGIIVSYLMRLFT